MCDQYLLQYYRESIIQILKEPDELKHYSLNINFVELLGNDLNLGNSFLNDPEKSLEEWDTALKTVQTNLSSSSDENYIFKKHAHSRIYSLPLYDEFHRSKFPQNEDTNKFLQVSGTVVRMTVVKMLEYKRQYICTKCKYVMTVNAKYAMKNNIKPPRKCGNPDNCKGTNVISLGELNPEFCKDYQEIKLQESVSNLDVGCVPNSMWVTLEDNLVDICKPGDNIIVCGLVKRRQNPFIIGKKMDIELVMKANHIQVNNNPISSLTLTPELKEMFQAFWETHADKPLVGRDTILKSICPQLFGLYVVKLAMAVVLAGGSNNSNNSNTGVRVRAESHLLLVGDPGTGKSHLLRFASKIIPRSVLTTGVGSTAAGLTVTAVMENGEWQLEGGALVMADGGICCIDEFNTMKEHDRTSIHEAMEQQTISVAKASIVCKLSTRCSILAATNPKGNIDPSQPLNMNIALASPLLSRFDLILLLQDKCDEEWESRLVDYNFNSFDNCNSSNLSENSYNWSIETLQAYFAIIRKLQPVLTDDANRILSAYYQAQRRQNYRNKARTTVRLLDSLVRLSQGHARLMFHHQVEIIDAVVAVVLVETSVEADWSVFNLSFNLRNDFPEDPINTYKELVEIVLKKLELNELLLKELDIMNRKKPGNKPGPSNATVTVPMRKESKFFQVEEQTACDNKSVANNATNSSKNVLQIEDKSGIGTGDSDMCKANHLNQKDTIRVLINGDAEESTSSKNDISKQIKEVEHVRNDLAALQCMPSIHDVFRMENLEIEEEDATIHLDAVRENEENFESEINDIDLPSGENISIRNSAKNNQSLDNINLESNNEKVNEFEVLSQKTRTKNWFNRFRFIPKDIPSENLLIESNKPDDIDISFANIHSSTQQEKLSVKTNDNEKPLEVALKRTKDLESESVKKFKFRKINSNSLNNIRKSPSSSIFEDEDVGNVDLDL